MLSLVLNLLFVATLMGALHRAVCDSDSAIFCDCDNRSNSATSRKRVLFNQGKKVNFCRESHVAESLSRVAWCKAAITRSSGVPLVTYDELRRLNATCDGLDTCHRRPLNDDLRTVNCQCGPSCARFGTCCLDSPHYVGGGVSYGGGLGCVTPYGNDIAFFMVDKCPIDWEGDDSVRDLCVGDGQARSDLMLLVPVSSLRRGITYRNYFCFICNSVDDPDDVVIPWDISLLFSNRSHALDVDLSTLTFDTKTFQWTHPRAPQNSILHLSTELPRKIPEKSMVYCRRNVISSCAANWTEPATRDKCESYTALVTMLDNKDFTSNTYRNVHCGKCNWMEHSSVILCSYYQSITSVLGATQTAARVFKELFMVSEVPENVCRQGQIWDRIAKKCRNFKCGRKMQMVKGRCVRKA